MDLPAGNRPSFPYEDSRAARLLRHALAVIHREQGLSIRKLGVQLGYKQATVLSHMASGRVPIPLERAPDIARATGLDPAEFLASCVEQRSPEASFLLSPSAHSTSSFSLAKELDLIAGHSIEQMSEGQKLVMREAASDLRASRRWLSVAELPVIELIRRLRPNASREGLSAADLRCIEACLKDTNVC